MNWATDGLGGQTIIYEVPGVSKIPEKIVFIDEYGGEWPEIDVWYVSIK
jgi:hypothetical protein